MSFFDDDGVMRETDPRPARRRVWLVLGMFVLLGFVGYLALQRFSDNRVPLGVTVEGVSIGGLHADEAVARLAQRLGPDLSQPIDFTSNDKDYPFDATSAGVRIDFRGTVAATEVGGSSWSPLSMWRFLTHGGDREAKVDIDRTTFNAALVDLAGTIGRPAIEGTLTFKNGHARPVYGRAGLSIDADETAQMVPRLLFSHDAAELPMAIRRPYVSRVQVVKALHTFGEPAMSGPVRLVIGGRSFVASPRLFGNAIQMVPSRGGLMPLVDGRHLASVLAPVLSTLGPKPVNATVTLRDGRPVVVPAVAGAAYDVSALSDAFVHALTQKGAARIARVHAAITTPRVSTATARGWHVTHKVRSVTATVDGALALKLDDRVVRPRQGLRVSQVLGRTDRRIGSAVFGLAMRSSMDVDSFSPTLAFHDNLPVGIAADDVELSAPAGRAWLIQVQRVGTRQARFTVWGASGLRAQVSVGPRTAPVAPTTVSSSSPDCTARPGQSGFSVTATRTGPGIPATFDSTYLPVSAVVCVPPPAPTAAP